MKFRKLFASALACCCLSAVYAETAEEAATIEVKDSPAVETPAPSFDYKAYFAALPETLASMDGQPAVTNAELLEFLTPQLEKMQKYSPAALSQLSLDSAVFTYVRTMLANKVLNRAAREAGMEPDLAKAKEYIDQAKENYGEERFNELLKQQGTTLEKLQQDMADSIMISALHEKILSEVPEVTEEEMRSFYDENKAGFTRPNATYGASHILAKFADDPVTPEAEAAALKKIEDIRKQLDDGMDFAELARENSDCPSAAQGGSLGEFTEGSMVPEFENALKELQVGEISGPVKTEFGYHLIKLEKTEPAGSTPEYDEIKGQIKQILGQKKSNEHFLEYLGKLQENYKTELFVKPPVLPKAVESEPEEEEEAAEKAETATEEQPKED